MEDSREAGNKSVGVLSGRMVFGEVKPQTEDNESKQERTHVDSDTEDDVDAKDDSDNGRQYKEDMQTDMGNDSISFYEDSQTHKDSVFKVIW